MKNCVIFFSKGLFHILTIIVQEFSTMAPGLEASALPVNLLEI